MKFFFKLIPSFIFFIVLIIFFYFLIIDRDPSEIPSALIKKKVPIFTTSSLFEKDEFVSTKEFGKQITLVNFFSSWCGPCRIEHSYLQRLSHNKKIKIIGINYKDDPYQAIKWLEELGNPYSSVAVDTNGQIAIDWGVYGIPETFVVNVNKTIIFRLVGPINKKTYNELYVKIKESF